MTEEKALVPSRVPTLTTWQTIQSIAPVATASRMFGVTEQQAAMVMLKGYELGLGLTAAFEFIHVIDGKPSISPKGALALIHDSNRLAGLKIEDILDDKDKPYSCKVWMKRRNGFEYTAIYTMDDAKQAGLVKLKSGWDKYPANMLRWRAVGYCADVVFPDVIGGLLRPEEFGAAVDVSGEPIEGEVVTVSQPQPTTAPTPTPAPVVSQPLPSTPLPTPAPVAPAPEPQAKELSLMEKSIRLAEAFGATAVFKACGGGFPSTEEEYQKAAETLGGEEAIVKALEKKQQAQQAQ